MFSTDRSNKYGWGALRLTALTVACVCYFDTTFSVVFASNRWLSFLLQGSIGAIVNVNIITPAQNIGLLLICGVAIGFDLQHDATMAVYLFKTLGGDFIAGKLDTLEWKISGIFAFIVAALCAVLSDTVTRDYGRIFSLLFIMQVFCEYGDNHFERFKFFRHRYSFELIHTMILFNLPNMTEKELRVILMDLVACAAYRSSNYTIIVLRKLIASDFFISAPRMLLYQLRGYLQGFRVQYVRDPDLAVAVMKHSNCKGFGLERVLSCPAWAPVLSLESIDGNLWEEMRKDFTILLKQLPGPEKLKKITKMHLDDLLFEKGTIDANAIALVTMKVFVEYLFNSEWDDSCNVLVAASWEWRKEIAAKGAADPEVKRLAIEQTISLVRKSPLWPLFGEKWTEARYYSLLLQPFLLSPTINTGDLMVAFEEHPDLDVTDAMRQMHPFPIFERFISTDLTAPADDTLSAKSSSPSSVSVSGCPCSGRMNADISVSKHSAHSAAAVSTHDSRGSNEDNSGNGSHSDSNGIDMEDDNESTELDSDYYPQKPVHTHTSSKSTSNTSSTHTHATRANVQAHAQATASSNPATANTNIVKNTAADSSFQPASHAHPSTHTTQSSAFPTPSSERTEKGRVLIPGNTQVVMFPSDWRENKSWPVFGAGKRACPGAHLALPFLTLFRETMMTLMKEEKIAYTKELSSIVFKDNKISGNKFSSRFQPSLNHLYSGRNNDDKGNFKEYIYFFTTIIPTFLFTRKIGNSDYCFE